MSWTSSVNRSGIDPALPGRRVRPAAFAFGGPTRAPATTERTRDHRGVAAAGNPRALVPGFTKPPSAFAQPCADILARRGRHHGSRLELVGDGRILRVGAIVRREEALSWLETIGVGAQHIVAMFGGTFVFPLITLGRTRTWRS
jgi:hypothetical protein